MKEGAQVNIRDLRKRNRKSLPDYISCNARILDKIKIAHYGDLH